MIGLNLMKQNQCKLGQKYIAHSISAMPVVYTWFNNNNTNKEPGDKT